MISVLLPFTFFHYGAPAIVELLGMWYGFHLLPDIYVTIGNGPLMRRRSSNVCSNSTNRELVLLVKYVASQSTNELGNHHCQTCKLLVGNG